MDWTSGGPLTIDGQVRSRDDLLADALAGADVLGSETVVAVVADPTLDTVVSIIGAMTAGVPVVPLSPDAGPLEREHVLADSGATVLIHAGERTAVANAASSPRPDAALLLYTSGTTGPPKGVPVTGAAIDACIRGLADAWQWTPDDVLVHGLPLYHVHGLVLGVLGPLIVGSSLVHTGRPTPAAYAQARGSLYFGVPTVWSRISRDAESAGALRSARLLVSGSATLPAPVFDALHELAGQAPLERYGMTETLITLSARADAPVARGSVGGPLPGVGARIVDDAGQSVEPGQIGELQVSGTSVMSGYLHRPDADAVSFTAEGWFRTGDVASIDAAGRYRIVGRASTDLIKSGGYRIGAGEVEDALLTHRSVLEAAVVGLPDDDLGQRIVAFVVADGVDADTLIAHVATALSWHKRPRQVVFVESLPRNAMGKVDKSGLRA